MATLNQMIWFCGFYEGEGSITNDKSNNNRLRVAISQNDPAPLKIAQQLWGGSVRKRVRKSPASEKICVGYEWRIPHHNSLKFISDIKPFMIIPYKINQVDEAIRISKIGNNDTYKCNFCDKSFASPSGRRRHEVKQHISLGFKFVCKICSDTYDSKDSLNTHMKSH